MQLTPAGYVIMEKMYDVWQFAMTEQDHELFRTGKGKLFLRNHVRVPYHYSSLSFRVFGAEVALEITVSGSISNWVHMFDA
jgi:hypothetical protein